MKCDSQDKSAGVRTHDYRQRLQSCFAVLFFLIPMALLGADADAAPPTDADRTFTPDPASVLRHGPAWRHPHAGWIILHIEGAPYDRGYQHGRLLAGEIVDYIKAIADQRSEKAPKEAWRDLRILSDALFLRRYDTEYLEEMKGIADGAAAAGAKFEGRRLDLLDIVTINSDIEVGFLESGLEASATGVDTKKFAAPQFSQPKARLKEHCSAFAANGPATADGKIVIGHITMSDLGYVSHFNVWIDIQPEKGHRVVFQTFPGGIQSGLDYYISDSGLIVTETTIAQTRFNSTGKALASRIRQAVQYADSIDRAVEILADESNGLYTNQWLLGDIKTNEIAMFELGTRRTKLWRSSRHEWPDGTTGFYWGCNNIRDPEVFKETVPDLGGKPANLVRYPRTRDKAWLVLFDKHKGRIDEAFGFEAFTTPPLAAFPSCDVKFTTTDLARKLQSWALFGPPLGQTWDPTPSEKKKYPDIKPLVSNDWALLGVSPQPSAEKAPAAVDLAAFPTEDHKDDHDDADIDADDDEVEFEARHPFAWRGTLLPKSDADIWLATGFAEYEKVIAFGNACHREAKSRKLSRAAQDLVDRALFAHESRWQTAVRRTGRDTPLLETRADPARRDWYDIASGKGVMLLAALRNRLGEAACDKLLDEFGTAHAGEQVTTSQFLEHCERTAGKPVADLVRSWLGGETRSTPADRNIWTIDSFEAEPEQALIVYGTLHDRAAQREAATLLQRAIARRFSNIAIPLRSDVEVTEDELRSHHLLLIGRPGTNRVADRCAQRLPVSFASGSFQVRQETYAHADSSIIAVGDNPLNRRFSAVVFAGLSATATWKCVQSLPEDDREPPAQVMLAPAGRTPKRFRASPAATSVAKP
jgi:Phospholipase B